MDLITELNTNSGQLRRTRQTKLMNFLNEKAEDDKLLNEAFAVQSVCENEENINYMNQTLNLRNKKRMQLKEKAEFINEKTEKAFDYFMLKLVEKSLLIEPEMIDINRNEIKEKVAGFRKLVSPSTKDIKGKFVSKVCECAECFVEEMYSSDARELLRVSLKENIERLAEEASILVREKVSKVIGDEKILSECITLKENNVLKKDIKPSLFKKLHLENLKLCLSENNCQTLNEELMDVAFYETIVDYTILEAFNTLELFGEIDGDGLRKNLSRNSIEI